MDSLILIFKIKISSLRKVSCFFYGTKTDHKMNEEKNNDILKMSTEFYSCFAQKILRIIFGCIQLKVVKFLVCMI